MQRRSLLLAAGAALAAPSYARAQSSKVLRFVPQADLPNLDAVAGTQLVVRNASLLVFDMLYGIGADLQPKPQMVEGHEVSADGRIWDFRLRPGLKFHDGEPVRSRDVVTSIQRWMVRDGMGQMIQSQLDALEAVDDRNFRFRLKAPFPKLLYALGKSNTPLLVIMPERIARTDPFKQITEYVGSGPMAFRRDEWVAGSRSVFERFAGYQPRQEAPDWLAGGKRMLVDRVEWLTMPDPGTAASALQSGEVDWWENPIADLVPLLGRGRNVKVAIGDPLGNVGSMRLNHLQAPFDNKLVRQALQLAVSQEDYMRAIVGDDTALWKTMPSFFTPGTPLYTEAGAERLKGPRHHDRAREMLKQAGYNGEKVALLVATDVPITKAQGDVTADMLARIGMNVDYIATDWGTVGSRRTSKKPVAEGGWSIFFSWHSGVDCINPAPYKGVSASGDKAWFGWPESAEVERHIADWYQAPDLAAEKAAIEGVNRAGMDHVTFIPTGFFLGHTAWRSNVTGVKQAPFPLFWGVGKG
ncbi:ABC transporter substrate-binding protein [Pseudoroseomonas deserti]|uniref:ABC transporter substrate-binding protein n=1 Tax=Teichococcus deserti TaxID=1817963 RepID=A0A1V2H8R7_9PROT|nr:ABC transporter substrate-binding protein [Pseudoroseomonas deserti]ONG58874.1 ABC transporter substrate-binding protein [Pseudoroseomonas deserti]